MNGKLEKKLAEIEQTTDAQTYLYVAGMLKDLTEMERYELESMSIIDSNFKTYDKIQKANKYLNSRKETVKPKSDPKDDIVKKFESLSVEQLLQIKSHLEAKPQLSASEIKFIEILENRIGNRRSK